MQQSLINLGLLLGAIGLWCVNLGQQALRDWDEGTYASVAREIQRLNHWLYPTLFGEPFQFKPPLVEWLIAISYQLFGVSELSTRWLPATLSALAVLLLYWIGCEIFQHWQPALFSALVYLTMLPVVRHGRLAMHDGIAITAFLLLFLCLLRIRYDRRWAIVVGISLGLIGFTKGILMLLLGGIAAIFLAVEGQLWALLGNPYFWLGFVLGEAPLIGWYIAQGQHYGSQFWQFHFQDQSFNRIWQSVERNSGPPWYYLVEWAKYGWPWLIFWPGGISLAWQQRQQPWARLVLIGTGGFLLAISVMTTKLPWYIMPLYPFVALTVGARLAVGWNAGKFYPVVWPILLGLLSLGSLGAGVYLGWTESKPLLMAIGVTLGITLGAAAWLSQQQNRQFIPILFAGMYLSLGLLMISNFWLWELNEAFPVKPVAALIKAKVPARAPLYISFYGRPSLNFYSDRLVMPLENRDLQKLWASRPYLLLDEATLAGSKLPRSQILGKAEGFTLIGPQPSKK